MAFYKTAPLSELTQNIWKCVMFRNFLYKHKERPLRDKHKKAASPCEDQAEQGADQNEDLVEHGWVCPLDRSVDVILPTTTHFYIWNWELCSHTWFSSVFQMKMMLRSLSETACSAASERAVEWLTASGLNKVINMLIKNSSLTETIKLMFLTHDHVLQSTLGQPAVEKHRNEDIPYWGPKNLQKKWDSSFSTR